MKLYAIALNGSVLKGYQVVMGNGDLIAFHCLHGLSVNQSTQLYFNTEKLAKDFLQRMSGDHIHVWFDTDVYLLEEFDIYPMELDKKILLKVNPNVFLTEINSNSIEKDIPYDGTKHFSS